MDQLPKEMQLVAKMSEVLDEYEQEEIKKSNDGSHS